MIVYDFGKYKIIDYGDDGTEHQPLKTVHLKSCECIFCTVKQ